MNVFGSSVHDNVAALQTEAVSRRFSTEQMFLRILRNSQETPVIECHFK